MKAGKKLITLALAVVILFSLAIPAFAESGTKYNYNYYMNIGDSIARCCGVDAAHYGSDEWTNAPYNGYLGQNIVGSYPYLVATEALGKAQADANLQYMGIRTVETLYALGGKVDPRTYDDYYSENFSWHVDGAGNKGSIDALKDQFQESVRKADLITLEIGMNDVFYSAAARAGLEDDTLTTDEKLERLDDLVKYMWEGYNTFLKYYPKLIDRIIALKGNDAKDLTLMLIGYFNPAACSALTEDIWLPVADVVSVITGLMNAYLKTLAAKYSQAIYVDVTATQTPISSGRLTVVDGFRADPTVNTHPTKEGYKYMARQIINALPPKAKTSYPSTYVQLNLSENFKVEKVYLDSTSASFVQPNNYNLVVTNRSTLHKTLIVMGTADKDGGGKAQVTYVYLLDYSLRNGYTARRLTSSSDVSLTLSRVLGGTVSIASKVTTAIGSLFKK